jgi:predicted Zn-dependent protease with MMP-like domain
MPRRDPIDDIWQLLDGGEIDAAEAACARAELKKADGEEILLCRDTTAPARDDLDGALGLLGEAIELAPDDPRPLLQAAEIELYGKDDPRAAIARCDAALEIAEGEEELADALLLKAEAELACDDDAAARASLDELDGADLGDASLWIRAGNLHLLLEDAAGAERAFRAALELEPGEADALHGLGMVHEVGGQRDAMVAAWLEVRRLDLAAPRPPWHLSPSEFEAVAEAAMAELPARIIELLENVPVLIDDAPSEDLVREGNDPRLLGLFSGVPLPVKEALSQGSTTLDSIHLYQRNLERSVASLEELEEEIRVTVLHETAHFFGLEEEDLEALGLD